MKEISGYNSRQPILLIEDNIGDARLVQILLEEFLIKTHHVSSLQEGFDALETADFSAVMLDLHLPDSRGFETVERLLGKYPETNVIVLTGLPDKNLGLRAVMSGAQDYLVKGEFSGEELTKTLRYSIERNRIKKRLEEAQRIAHLASWELDLEKKLLDVSDEFYRISGLPNSGEPLPLQKAIDVIHDEDKSIEEVIRQSLISGQEAREDLRIIRPDGEIRYITISCKIVRNSDGEARIVSGIIQDVTARELAAQELLNSKQHYQRIFTQSKDAIYLTTVEGKFKDFNQAAVELFGYSKEELIELHVGDLYKVPEQRNILLKNLEKSSFVKDYPVEFVRKGGELRYCLVTASMTESDDFKAYHGIIRDVTEARKVEELMKEKEIAAKTASLKEKFLANVSHEMRTPLNAVLGMSHLLVKTPLNEEQFNYVNTIKSSSEHLLDIINDILEISKLQYGEIQLENKLFDIHHLVTDIFNMVSFQAADNNLQAELRLDKEVNHALIGDPIRIKEIILNLCANAIKFTEKGNIRLSIGKVRQENGNVWLLFSVSDTGIGIEKDKLEVIFENFTRVSDSKHKIYEGVGLGLAIVKSLVEMMGGRIHVESTFGEGSTFSVELPFGIGDQAELETMRIKPVPRLEKNRKTCILLVEDEKVNQFVARKIINKEWPEAKVVIANNGKEAIEKLAEEDIEIILMDIQMPVMGGVEATRVIRSELPPGKANLPILAMTAHAHVAQEKKYKEYLMDDCVLKPFTPDELFEKISKYIPSENEEKINVMNETRPTGDYQFIDLSYLELMADGDAEMKAILLEMLLKEPEVEFAKMKDLAKAEDWDTLKQVSHKMKTTLPYIGFETLTETNVRIDRILWEHQQEETNLNFIRENIPGMVDAVSELYAKAKVELEKEFQIIKLSVS